MFTALCSLLLRIFFRRIDSVDIDRVPRSGPLLYVLNHPNGLLDPLFILCESPRPVTFLAKAPLFDTFVVKRFVRAFECLPVYRAQDGADTSRNREVILAAIELLAGAKVLALFPEGTSHSDPKLRPLKTGAARIALGASGRSPSAAGTSDPVRIIPVGIDYSQKTIFRSDALLVYGEPIVAPQLRLDEDMRAPASAVEALNAEIAAGLGRVTLQADDAPTMRLADQAARILAGAREDAGELPFDPFDLRRRLIQGYRRLRASDPARLDALAEQVRRFEAEMSMLGLPLDHPGALPARAIRRYVLEHAVVMPLLLAPALLGLITHYPAYRLVGWLSLRMSKKEAEGIEGVDVDEAVTATFKLIAGFLLFPLTWLVLGAAVGVALRWTWGLLALALLPFAGLCALLFFERLDDIRARARGLWVLTTRTALTRRLVAERREIHDAIVALAEEAWGRGRRR
nr:lysophospholipid acyltransferase family protein [Pseudenhygromyxa sp. WMMC2535]